MHVDEFTSTSTGWAQWGRTRVSFDCVKNYMNDVAATTQNEGQRKGRRALTRYQLVGLTKDLFYFSSPHYIAGMRYNSSVSPSILRVCFI